MRRREFLQRTGGLAAAAAGLTVLGDRTALAISPIVRPGEPKFKFSLAAYSYRDLLQSKTASYTLSDFVRDCAARVIAWPVGVSHLVPGVQVMALYTASIAAWLFNAGAT